MNKHLDIIATWPKTRPLESYLDALKIAEDTGKVINFRVANLPIDLLDWAGRHRYCYMVHDGYVRGYNEIRYAVYRGLDEVWAVDGGAPWPEGNYIVRDPIWHPVEPVPMRGFQGWRYYTYGK